MCGESECLESHHRLSVYSSNPEEWVDTICSYTFEGNSYCLTHKPDGASPARAELRRMFSERFGAFQGKPFLLPR